MCFILKQLLVHSTTPLQLARLGSICQCGCTYWPSSSVALVCGVELLYACVLLISPRACGRDDYPAPEMEHRIEH